MLMSLRSGAITLAINIIVAVSAILLLKVEVKFLSLPVASGSLGFQSSTVVCTCDILDCSVCLSRFAMLGIANWSHSFALQILVVVDVVETLITFVNLLKMMTTVALRFLGSFTVEIAIVEGFERITFIVASRERLLSRLMAWTLEAVILTSDLRSSVHASFT